MWSWSRHYNWTCTVCMTLLLYTGPYWKRCKFKLKWHIIHKSLWKIEIMIKTGSEKLDFRVTLNSCRRSLVSKTFWQKQNMLRRLLHCPRRRNYASFALLIKPKPRLEDAVQKKSNWYKERISSLIEKVQPFCLCREEEHVTISSLHTNVSQKQHAKCMINHFLITNHGKDNWKLSSGRGILKRYFCVLSTTGTNSESEAPWGPVCLQQNCFSTAEWRRAERGQ